MPLLGLGLYGGHRGRRWLRNRIKIFKQFVLPSLEAQSNKNFILWVSVRHEDVHDPLIREFREFLENATPIKSVFTYTGVCFWDDKYPDDVARGRLVHAIHGGMGYLINAMGDAETVLMTIQPSDDCYYSGMVEETQREFEADPTLQVFGYKCGWVMDYVNLKLAEWNPNSYPPFVTIKFPREIFTDPFKHLEYTSLKHDIVE